MALHETRFDTMISNIRELSPEQKAVLINHFVAYCNVDDMLKTVETLRSYTGNIPTDQVRVKALRWRLKQAIQILSRKKEA